MGLIRRLALIVLAISLLTFIALFGQLPRLRKTPIGYIHRVLRYKFPALLSALDHRLTSGALTPLLLQCGNFIINEKHPLVMGFYLTLVTSGVYMFTISGWVFLSSAQKALVLLVVPLPYISIFLASSSDPGIITPSNHKSAVVMYPYDRINFFPPPHTPPCRTCNLQKPARSKHCSVCKGCVAKHDHHCIWINNCIGLSNTRHFVFFLLSTDLLLAIGGVLSFRVLNTVLKREGINASAFGGWIEWSRFIGLAVVDQVYIGAVFLLCILCGILSGTFTLYHLYLIWAGTTANETTKWSGWKDDIRDGIVFRAEVNEGEVDVALEDMVDKCKSWPRKSEQCLYRIEPDKTEDLPRARGVLWQRVESLAEVDNIYDLGGLENFKDVIWPGKLL